MQFQRPRGQGVDGYLFLAANRQAAGLQANADGQWPGWSGEIGLVEKLRLVRTMPWFILTGVAKCFEFLCKRDAADCEAVFSTATKQKIQLNQ